MKRIIILFIALIPSVVIATTTPIVITLPNPLGTISTIPALISAITGFLRDVAYWVAPIGIIVAAYYFLFSGGDSNKIKTARDILIWTLVGVLIVTAADLLMTIIRDALGVTP